MNMYYITFRSVTTAQRAVRALEQAGVTSRMARTPNELIPDGCGYSVKVIESRFNAAIIILDKSRIQYGKVFFVMATGESREVFI